MKKLTNIILALAAISVYCSCADEEHLLKEGSSDIRVYSDLSRTRTDHKSENGVTSISWVKGDEIGLSTSEQGNLCYLAEISGPTSDFSGAAVTLDAKDGDVVYAYYPYDKWSWPGTETSFHLPNTQGQTYSSGLAYYDVLYAKGTISDNELALHFKHVFAFLKITVPVDKLVWDSDSGCYVIRIISDQLISSIEGNYNIETEEFESNCTTDVMYWIDEDIEGQETVTITAAIMPQTYGARISIYAWADNFSVENLLRTIDVPECGLEAGKIYSLTISDGQQAIERELSVQALTALYNSTNGDEWKNNTNWFSDEPLYKWYGLNANYWPESTIEVDDIVEIQLFNNNLRGTLPVEFAHIMSKANSIQIEGNGLYGAIPKEVREHPRWQKFGWNVLAQNPWIGGGFDFSEGTGLVLPECEISFFVEENSNSSSNVLKENELTFVVNAGAVDAIEGISDERVSYYEKYKNKGLGMIVTVGGYWDYPYDEYRDYVMEKRAAGLPEDIMWAKTFIESGMGYGEIHLFDKDGNLLGAWMRDYGIDEKWYLDQMDVIVRDRLGEPEDNPVQTADYIDEYGINHGQGIEIDGIVWAPVNCGYKAATETDNGYPYGKLYQWGRKYGQGYDGDATTPEIYEKGRVDVSVGNDPDNANIFYPGDYVPSLMSGVYDWVTPSNGTLWNSGTESDPIKSEYDPCPTGWRVPTSEELNSLVKNHSWATNDGQLGQWFTGSNAYAAEVPKIFLPAAGCRGGYGAHADSGQRNTYGYYWSSNASGEAKTSHIFFFNKSGTISSSNILYRNIAFSVRCVKE